MGKQWRNMRTPDDGGLARWQQRTPLVLQDAIRACYHGKGTPAQSRLLSAWVIARVWNADVAIAELLLGRRAA